MVEDRLWGQSKASSNDNIRSGYLVVRESWVTGSVFSGLKLHDHSIHHPLVSVLQEFDLFFVCHYLSYI